MFEIEGKPNQCRIQIIQPQHGVCGCVRMSFEKKHEASANTADSTAFAQIQLQGLAS